jgi:hypothetical protein
MHSVQVAESIKLEKTELEFELGQLTGQVERLQARIRTLIEEQVKTPNHSNPSFIFSYFTGFIFRLFKSRLLAKILASFHCAIEEGRAAS